MDPPGDEIPTLYVDDEDFVALVKAVLETKATDADTRVGVTSADEAVSSLRSGDVNWLVTAAGHYSGDPVRGTAVSRSQTAAVDPLTDGDSATDWDSLADSDSLADDGSTIDDDPATDDNSPDIGLRTHTIGVRLSTGSPHEGFSHSFVE